MQNTQLGEWFFAKNNPPSVLHVVQTTMGVMLSLLIARWFRLPEAYWAPMSTLIVMQSTLGVALPISVQYFVGTAFGAAVGAVVDTYFHGAALAFGASVLAIGLLGVILQVERSAPRYANITLAIVMLVPRSTSARLVALHRFFEVSIGLAVGLAIFRLWPRINLALSAKANVEGGGTT